MIVYSVVEQWNSDGGTVWWNSETVSGNGGTVIVDSVVEQWNSYGGTVLVEQGWWNSETVIVDQCGGTLEQCGATVEQ